MFALLDRESFEVVLFLCFALLVGWLRWRASEPGPQQPGIAMRKLQAFARRWCA